MSLFILTSCQAADGYTIAHYKFKGDKYKLLFFSNNEDMKQEENYYDVLIDLKRQYPKEVSNLDLTRAENTDELIQKYNIKTFPSLILMKENKVVLRMEGEKSEKEIKASLVKLLNN